MKTTRVVKRAIAVAVIAAASGILPATVTLPGAWEHGPAKAVLRAWDSSRADAYYGTSRRVARRTSRRTSYRQNTMYNSGVYPGVGVGAGLAVGAATTAAVLTSLPPNCVTVHEGGAVYHRCGSTMYQPLYQGDTLVYAPVE